MHLSDTRRARPRLSASLVGVGLALGLAAGCGGDDDAGAFIGTWQIIEGNAVACGTLSAPLGGSQVKMTAGTDAPLQVDVRGCLMKFDISGSTATARADQMCKTTFEFMGSNLAVDLAVSKAEFTVDGMTGNLNMMGTAMTTFLPGGGCPYQAMAQATKVTP